MQSCTRGGLRVKPAIRFLKHVTACRDLLVWGRTREKAVALKEEIDHEWEVSMADSPQELLQSCNIIVTTTCSREALLDGPVAGPLLIICIGADTVGKQELSTDLVTGADCLVCDSILQTQERGEFQHVLRENMVNANDILQLGQAISGSGLGESRRLTIFDSSGVAVQDCVVAKMVYEALLGSH